MNLLSPRGDQHWIREKLNGKVVESICSISIF